jgi:asparagine N-glycosylation enzyme membrane subunit Stt3
MFKTIIFCLGGLLAGLAIFVLSLFFPPVGLVAHAVAAHAITRLARRYLPIEHVPAAVFVYAAPFLIPLMGGLYGFVSGWRPMRENAVLTGVGVLGGLLGYWGYSRVMKLGKRAKA